MFYTPVYVDMYRDGALSIGSQQGEANVYVQYQRKGYSLKCFRTISKMFTSNSSGKCLRPKSAETRPLKCFHLISAENVYVQYQQKGDSLKSEIEQQPLADTPKPNTVKQRFQTRSWSICELL